MKMKILLFAMLTILGNTLKAQNDTNLLKNPSFEEHHACPESMLNYGSQLKLSELEDWYIASRGTPDYYQECSAKDECGVPENMWGYQTARTGDGYVGIVCTNGGRKGNYREYIQTMLRDTLTGGQKYYAEFYISLAEISSFTTNTIGLYVSKNRIQGHSTKVIGYDTEEQAKRNLGTQRAGRIMDLNFEADTIFRMEYLLLDPVVPQVKSTDFVSDTSNWVKVSGIFTAQGGERYVTIGSFEKTKRKKKDIPNRQKIKLRSSFVSKKQGRHLFLNRLSKTTYYYLDDVLIKPVNETSEN